MVLRWSRASALGRFHLGPNGLSQVGLARVRPGESSGNPVVTPGEMLVFPRWQPNLVGTVTALAGTLASRPFSKETYGEIGPPAHLKVRAFIFFSSLIYFIDYLRGLGFLALILSLLILRLPKKDRSGKKKKLYFTCRPIG